MGHIRRIGVINSEENKIEVLIHNLNTGKGVVGIAHTAVTIFTFKKGLAGVGSAEVPVAGTVDSWVENGWVEVTGTGKPDGLYQYSIPDSFYIDPTNEMEVIMSFSSAQIETEEITFEMVPLCPCGGVQVHADGWNALGIEGKNAKETVKAMASVLLGVTEGAGTNKTIFKAMGNDAVSRVEATTDENKDRIEVDISV